MTGHEFGNDPTDDLVNVEDALLLRDARVKDHLEQ